MSPSSHHTQKPLSMSERKGNQSSQALPSPSSPAPLYSHANCNFTPPLGHGHRCTVKRPINFWL
ncbi:hypothetical protein VTL71DRAFT_14795 [Oculimacula yallundae]|uniref:Uncharacterized protein n=1 Tax=Oculimacula yallundae TaxID=86028 RepID=A0ABR4CJH1_9HELO